MARKKSKKNNKKSSRDRLSFSIITFLVLSIVAIMIIFNKGKIGSYSLVKIQSASGSEDKKSEPDEEKDKLEITSEKKYLSVKSKETTELTVTLNGEEIDLSEVEIESSNEDVMAVIDGTVKAVSTGKATITVTKDDLTATVDLRAIIPIKSIQFTTTNSVVKVGKVQQMKLIASPSDASIETLKYESSDENIATVNSNGIVTGVAPGNVTITVKDSYNDIEKSVKLTIKK